MLLGAMMRSLLPTMAGNALGTVVASTDPGLPAGAFVLHVQGWRGEYTLLDAGQSGVVDTDDSLLMLFNGFTAYTGLTVAGPQRGNGIRVGGGLRGLQHCRATRPGDGRRAGRGSTGSGTSLTGSAGTPLLGWFMLQTTWTNVREHAAGQPNYWGSRGRGFESRRPDQG
jgi:hypothetical protein